MLEITIKEKDFFLPEDGAEAETVFLNMLNDGYSELWICAFGFTLQPMFDAIKAADAKGMKVHILLDHMQEAGHAEAPKVKDLVDSLKNGDVTITTAGINSGKPSQIWHWKGMVAKYNDGNTDIERFGALGGTTPAYFCWEGSTNFSESAWFQGNSARIFASDEWATKFIAQQLAHIAWARENEPQYQLSTIVAASIAEQGTI